MKQKFTFCLLCGKRNHKEFKRVGPFQIVFISREKKRCKYPVLKDQKEKLLPELDLHILVVSTCSHRAANLAGRNGCVFTPWKDKLGNAFHEIYAWTCWNVRKNEADCAKFQKSGSGSLKIQNWGKGLSSKSHFQVIEAYALIFPNLEIHQWKISTKLFVLSGFLHPCSFRISLESK